MAEKGKEKIEIRMTIEGKLAFRLAKLKEHYELESYTELIRVIITDAYDRVSKTFMDRTKRE